MPAHVVIIYLQGANDEFVPTTLASKRFVGFLMPKKRGGVAMNAVAALTGMAAGAVEFVILLFLIRALLKNDAGMIFFFVMLKLLVWGLFFALVVLLMRNEIMWAGIGAAAALVLSGFAGFLINWKRQTGEKREDGV